MGQTAARTMAGRMRRRKFELAGRCNMKILVNTERILAKPEGVAN